MAVNGEIKFTTYDFDENYQSTKSGSILTPFKGQSFLVYSEDGKKVIRKNRSFIFFQEVKNTNPDFGPVAAAGVQLTPGRSLAVDRNIHAYGLPVWISTVWIVTPGTALPAEPGLTPKRSLLTAIGAISVIP